MNYNTVLIICFSLCLSGCATIEASKGTVWPAPPKPQTKPVAIESRSSGYYMSSTSASNLVDNVEELKAYIAKLEALVNIMVKCHGDKLEEKSK